MVASETGESVEGRDWSEVAKGILRGELKRQNMTYAHLVAALAESGVRESEANLRNKISRGNFSAAFFLQCLDAIGVNMLLLNTDTHVGKRRFSSAAAKIKERQALMDRAAKEPDGSGDE